MKGPSQNTQVLREMQSCTLKCLVFETCISYVSLLTDCNCLFQKFELLYSEQLRRGHVSEKTQFDYAWCLIRSRYQEDMKQGVALLEGDFFFFLMNCVLYCHNWETSSLCFRVQCSAKNTELKG